MICFKKDGKVDTGIDNVGDYINSRQSIADALDVAVAALRWYADPVAYSMPVLDMEHHVFPDRGKTASDALVKIGADHAD